MPNNQRLLRITARTTIKVIVSKIAIIIKMMFLTRIDNKILTLTTIDDDVLLILI